MGRAPEKPLPRRRSISRRRGWKTWPPSSAHEADACRCYGARHRSDPGLGKLVLFSRRARRADRRRYRLVAGLGDWWCIDRPSRCRPDRTESRDDHRSQGWPTGARCELAALRRRPYRDRTRSELADLPAGLARARRRHGNRPLRRRVPALGKLYGTGARRPITNLTLFGGFASTVCWPLSAFL